MAFADGKSPDAFRTIREVSEHLGVPQHILRFWETRFPQLKPMQRGGNRRYYRPADIALAAALHRLLHQDGYTVKGVQKLIAEHGADGLVALAGSTAAVPTRQAAKAAGLATQAASLAPQTASLATLLPGQPAAPAAAMAPALLSELRAVRDRLAAALAA